HRVAQPEVAPQRDAARDLPKSNGDVGHAGQVDRRRTAADRKIDSPGELVPEIVARRQLGSGENGGREETVSRGRVEEELIPARTEEAPPSTRPALLRVVLELAARQAGVGGFDQVVRDFHVRN